MIVKSSFFAFNISLAYIADKSPAMKYCYTIIITVCCFLKVSAQQANLSSNLPIIVINTNGVTIPDEPKIKATMGIINNPDGQRNHLSDPFNEYNGYVGIEVRGESSQMFPMKSYSIELWDENEESLDASLFGMPEESDWVLYAPYNDKTLMHNFLAYSLSNNMGHWAAHCRYAEVILNGEYVGIYVFMERIKRDKGRVDIKKLDPEDTTADKITGGYIYSIDKDADAWVSKYKGPNSFARVQFKYEYPKAEDISAPQKAYIKNYTDSFENALHGNNFQDPVNGFRHYADEFSFIDYFIVNELSRNVDGYHISTYMYKDRDDEGGKIIMGPVWDYDIAFRNANYCSGSDTTGWAYRYNYVCPPFTLPVPFWWDRFMQDTAFQSNLLCRWKDLRKTLLSKASLSHTIDSIAALTAEARKRHFKKWPVLGTYVWPNPDPIPQTYEQEIQVLKYWLDKRMQWIDKNLPQTGACKNVNITGETYNEAVADKSAATEKNIFAITPNPGRSNFIIKSNSANFITMQVFSAQGVQIGAGKGMAAGLSNQLNSLLQSKVKGIYLVRLSDNKTVQTIKLVVD